MNDSNRDGSYDPSPPESGPTARPPIPDNEFRYGFLCGDLLRIALIIGSRGDERETATDGTKSLSRRHGFDVAESSSLPLRPRSGQQNQILSQPDIDELYLLLAYANRFHHDTNAAYETEAINDRELIHFSERVLAFARRS